jgi:hypothetical protein
VSKSIGIKTEAQEIADLRRRIEAIERGRPDSFSFVDSSGVRVRIGQQLDGKYGVRVWNSSGVLVYDSTTA